MLTQPRPNTTDRIGYLLKRAQSALNAAMTTALSGHGVTLPQYAVLVALDEEPGLSNADLARRAFVTPQTMNQVLRELEDKQLVSRSPHPQLGRVLQARLTGSGQQTLHHCRHAIDTVEDRMLAHLPPARQRQLAHALRTCTDTLTDLTRE